MGIDTTNAPYRNTIYLGATFGSDKRKALAPAALVYGRWYSWRIRLKWSSGSDGFIKWWLNGRLLADWTGPTIGATDGGPYLQFGFYSAAQLRNEVFHAALRKGISASATDAPEAERLDRLRSRQGHSKPQSAHPARMPSYHRGMPRFD